MRPAKLRRLLALTASGAILAGTCTGWAARADTVTGEGVFMPRGSTAKQFGGAFCPCVTVSSMPTSVRSQSAKLDAAVMASAGPTVVVAFSLSAVAADDMVADWIADPATAPDPQRVWIVTTGNPLNRYGGTQRDRAAAIPAVQPYRHLDVVNQYDSVADRPARWGWYSQRELSLSRHLAYDEVDINAPENLVYRDGNTTYMLVPAKELRQLRGLRFLRDIGWVTPERYDELDAERRTRIEADYDVWLDSIAELQDLELKGADELGVNFEFGEEGEDVDEIDSFYRKIGEVSKRCVAVVGSIICLFVSVCAH